MDSEKSHVIMFFMNILNRYFLKQLFLIFIMLTLILTGLAWMTQILSLLYMIIKYGVSLWAFVKLSSMMIPFIVSIIMPFLIFIAIMFVYNRMIGDREIPVLQASGLSPVQIAKPGIIMATTLMIIHYLMTIWLIPMSQERFYTYQWELRFGLAHLKIQEASFVELGNGMVVFVEKVNGNHLYNLFIQDARDKKNQTIITAQSGQLVHTVNGVSIEMKNGAIQSKTENLTLGTFSEYEMNLNLGSDAEVKKFKVRTLPTKLLISDEFRNDPVLKRRVDIVAEIGNRFLGPFMDVILALVALIGLLKTSTLRRSFSIAIPITIGVMGLVQAGYMTMLNMAHGDMRIIYLIGFLQLVLFFGLIGILYRDKNI